MYAIILSLCSSVTFVLVLMMCSCWKRKRQKDYWLGLDGMVTQKNPDENVNHLPACSVPNTTDKSLSMINSDPLKGPQAANNTRRSLPDIPSESLARGDGVWDPAGDNSSDLYATVVEPQPNLAKRHTLPNGLESRASNSQHSSICPTDDAFSPYASVNYDKLKKLEHPYAVVKQASTSDHVDSTEDSPTARTCLLQAPTPSTQPNEAALPASSSRRSSGQSNVAIDINAASAVAGGIAANQELPYMTPPIGPTAQLNFSGDSQDSSKGYTSISVREPLANIRAETKDPAKSKKRLDPHYSTVSDDSDEMYTTIPDSNNQVYTSGSETYAQIQPLALTVEVEVNPVPSSSSNASVEHNEATDTYSTAPQPPSVDSLKHMTHSHSRQDVDIFAASSASSILNLGSPKPEKRQANSPLPPPPSPPPAFTSNELQVEKQKLDDMYAKVHKTRKKLDESADKSISSTSSSDDKDLTPRKEHNYETLKKKNSDPGYEQLNIVDDCVEPNYASINGPDSLNTDPGYEVLGKDHHGYSTIREANIAGYSVVNKKKNLSLEQTTKDLNNYESVSESDPKYESVNKGIEFDECSQKDPNYETVNPTDPNYESVKYLDLEEESSSEKKSLDSSNSVDKNEEPPYEKLNDESESPGYEKIEKATNNDYETIMSDKTSGGDCASDDEIYQV